MSRSGYVDDLDDWSMIKWRGAVASAVNGRRGQAFLQDLAAALDAMPDKRLAAGSFKHTNGCHCTLGVLASARGIDTSLFDRDPDDLDNEAVAESFGIAPSMAREIMFFNDEAYSYECALSADPDAKRWELMRAWISDQIHA